MKNILFISAIIFSCLSSQAQTCTHYSSDDTLTVDTMKGTFVPWQLVLPRIHHIQPCVDSAGLVAYNPSDSKVYVFDGLAWVATGGSTSNFLNASFTATHGDQRQNFNGTGQVWDSVASWTISDTNGNAIISFGENPNPYANFYSRTLPAFGSQDVIMQTANQLGTNEYRNSVSGAVGYEQVNFSNFKYWFSDASSNTYELWNGNRKVIFFDSAANSEQFGDIGNTDLTITPNTFTFNGGDIVSGDGRSKWVMNTAPRISLLFTPNSFADANFDAAVYDDDGMGSSGAYFNVFAHNSDGSSSAILFDANYYMQFGNRYGESMNVDWDSSGYYLRTITAATNLTLGTNNISAFSIGGNTQYISLLATPTYASDAAAAVDTALPSGGLYLITGATGLHQKP